MHMGKRETANPNRPCLSLFHPTSPTHLTHIRPFPPQLGSPAVSNLHGLAERFDVVRCCCFFVPSGGGRLGVTYLHETSLPCFVRRPHSVSSTCVFCWVSTAMSKRCDTEPLLGYGARHIQWSTVLPTISTKLSYRVRIHAARIPPS